jgi:hypothetical protein
MRNETQVVFIHPVIDDHHHMMGAAAEFPNEILQR